MSQQVQQYGRPRATTIYSAEEAALGRYENSLSPVQVVVVSNLHVKPGQSIEVKGYISARCTDFAITLGKDPENLLLHFNPRFDLPGVTNKIICNSRENNVWGEEQREHVFPFERGSHTEVSFKYEKWKINILLPSGSWFTFPVRLSAKVISYLSLKNLELKCLKIE